MRSIRLAVLLIVVTGLPVAAADLAAAKKDFVRFCSKCHGTAGKGDGPQADALATKPRSPKRGNAWCLRAETDLLTATQMPRHRRSVRH